MKTAKVFRVLTVAPLAALAMLLLVLWREPAVFGGPLPLVMAVLWLTVLPLLAYPLQPLFPRFRAKGREGQRTLAMIFAVAGYVGGCVTAFVGHASDKLKVLFLTYLFSGILVVAFNRLLPVRASGHACGMAGPGALLLYFHNPAGWAMLALLAAVWWSSLVTRRHTVPQLAAGTILPLFALGGAAALVSAL